ncbi:MAG: hypothetical protein WBH35_03085 [Bacillota bacterium]|nr:hypothetical protein [Bacillota bacterium]HPZ54575.1 hypothetical protein [Bacillota bacterium]
MRLLKSGNIWHGGIYINYLGYIAMLVVLGVVYQTLTYARRVLSEGNPIGAAGICVVCALATALAVYQLFLK